MAYEDKTARTPARFHSLQLEGREKLTLSGVEDVAGFDENLVVLTTSLGELSIRGKQLHIERIDLDSGALELRGQVQEMSYEETARSGGLLARLFG